MKRFLAIWICIAFLAGCASFNDAVEGSAETESSDAVTETVRDAKERIDFSAQYIRTDGYHEDVSYPVITVIRSWEELEAYYEANKDLYNLERHAEVYSDTTIGFLDAMERYGDSFFDDSSVILILLEEGSGSIRHEVKAVSGTADGVEVEIDRLIPEMQTCDMAEWHIMIETTSEVDDRVTVSFFGVDV